MLELKWMLLLIFQSEVALKKDWSDSFKMLESQFTYLSKENLEELDVLVHLIQLLKDHSLLLKIQLIQAKYVFTLKEHQK